jgi:nucleotide-binding universal stress UspA family protein
MPAIRTILAATDFSPQATQAARRAAILAVEHRARLILLNVVEPDGLLTLRDWLAKGRDLRAAVEEQARMLLDACADQIEQEHSLSVERVVRLGSSVPQVHEASIPADLVVLGSRGANALRQVALGTFADRLVRTAVRPVLVVRRPAAGVYQRALALTDFSPSADAALGATLDVAPGAQVHLLPAFDLPFEGKLRLAGARTEDIVAYREEVHARVLDRMQQAVTAAGSPARLRQSVVAGDVRTEALHAIDLLQPDLIAVGKQGESLLEDLLLGSTTSCMLLSADCDVLVVPRRAAAA